MKNNFEVKKNIFFDKNLFKGKTGIFEINMNKITHDLSFYYSNDNDFTKIF